tara:strand:+ start:358 stop:780 length:423 start_codon:yes stop_codon:yes gene_type:complete
MKDKITNHFPKNIEKVEKEKKKYFLNTPDEKILHVMYLWRLNAKWTTITELSGVSYPTMTRIIKRYEGNPLFDAGDQIGVLKDRIKLNKILALYIDVACPSCFKTTSSIRTQVQVMCPYCNFIYPMIAFTVDKLEIINVE